MVECFKVVQVHEGGELRSSFQALGADPFPGRRYTPGAEVPTCVVFTTIGAAEEYLRGVDKTFYAVYFAAAERLEQTPPELLTGLDSLDEYARTAIHCRLLRPVPGVYTGPHKLPSVDACPRCADLEQRLERAEAVCRAIDTRTPAYRPRTSTLLRTIANTEEGLGYSTAAAYVRSIANAYDAYAKPQAPPAPQPEPPHEWHAGDIAKVVDEPRNPYTGDEKNCWGDQSYAGKIVRLIKADPLDYPNQHVWWNVRGPDGEMRATWQHNLRPLSDAERREYHADCVRKAVRQALETGNHVRVLYAEGSMPIKCIAASGNLWSSKDNRVVAAHRVTAVEVRQPGEWRTVEID